MPKIDHILFPIDFSERCCHAAPFVDAMAKRYGAKITLIAVAQPFYPAAMGDGPVVIDTEELARDLQTSLDGALVNEFPGLQVDRVAELGDPAQVITDFAHTHGVGLIMMPTHGYGPFRSLLLGSVTAKVLHDAKCPVWTAAHVATPPSRDHVEVRTVLCAADTAPEGVPLVKWASEFSKETGAALRLVHVVSGMEGLPSRQLDREFEEQMRKDATQAMERLQESAGVSAPMSVLIGNIAKSVRDEARQCGADVVVIGRGTLQEKLGRLRTHAYAIIRQSPCPVVSV